MNRIGRREFIEGLMAAGAGVAFGAKLEAAADPNAKASLTEAERRKEKEEALKVVEPSVAKLRQQFGLKDQDLAIIVDPNRQALHVVQNGDILKSYAISTAKKGMGITINSEQTPWGAHRIGDKVGQNLAEGARVKPGMTTRILKLNGLEPGVNKGGVNDSASRGIYIHGTPAEKDIGKPASHGCVRMKNHDVAELFNLVPSGTLVEIQQLVNQD